MLHRVIPTHPARLREIRALVRDAVPEGVLPPTGADDVVLAVSEACANVLGHTDSGMIDLRMEILPDRVEVQISDSGVFRSAVRDVDVRAGSGRGLMLILAMMDEVGIKGGTASRPGTVLHLVKYREGRP